MLEQEQAGEYEHGQSLLGFLFLTIAKGIIYGTLLILITIGVLMLI